MLYSLVLANGPVKYMAVLRIAGSPPQCGPTEASGFGGQQHAFWIQAVQNVGKSLALFADAIGYWHFQAIDKKLVGIHRLSPKLFYFPHLYATAIEVGIEQAESFSTMCLVYGCRAGKQQDFGCYLSRGYPDFLAIDHIRVAPTHRCGTQLE